MKTYQEEECQICTFTAESQEQYEGLDEGEVFAVPNEYKEQSDLQYWQSCYEAAGGIPIVCIKSPLVEENVLVNRRYFIMKNIGTAGKPMFSLTSENQKYLLIGLDEEVEVETPELKLQKLLHSSKRGFKGIKRK